MTRTPGWVPCLRVRDAHASAEWYAWALGFKIDSKHQFEPGFPWFIFLSREPLKLYLSEHRGTGADNAETYLYVEDVDALHADLVTKGIAIEQAPETQPWGVREMLLRDPDGHRFNIGTDLPQ